MSEGFKFFESVHTRKVATKFLILQTCVIFYISNWQQIIVHTREHGKQIKKEFNFASGTKRDECM